MTTAATDKAKVTILKKASRRILKKGNRTILDRLKGLRTILDPRQKKKA